MGNINKYKRQQRSVIFFYGKKIVITFCFLLFGVIFCYGQKENILIKGNIAKYASQPLYLYKCYGDTMPLIDSIRTDKKGDFLFLTSSLDKMGEQSGLYKIDLQKNQFFYFLYNSSLPKIEDRSVNIKTLYKSDFFYNIATDSLVVLSPSAKKNEGYEDNKLFYEFQNIQQKINIANYFLLQMMRLYPLPDPFHKQIEDEYFVRYDAMDKFVKKLQASSQEIARQSLAKKLTYAYYQSVLPDWKQPDPWRDSIIAFHYFDYFNPADSFYYQTNILPEKIDVFLQLRTNKKDSYGQPIRDEMISAIAAQDFMEKIKGNQRNFDFCLNYFLKKFNKEHLNDAFFFLYNKYGKPLTGDCASSNTDLNWAREKASVLQGIQIGIIAPDFEIYPIENSNYSATAENGKLKMLQLKEDYTLILFWATWCSHCTEAVPKIKETISNFNADLAIKGKKLITVTISLDTDKEKYLKYLKEQGLQSFINFSEYKGWQSEIGKKYNVYATPTMFLLDKDKRIISKPTTLEELIDALTKIK